MRVSFGKLTAALLTTTALGLGGAEISANLIAQAQVRHLLARHEGARIGGVSFEPFSGRLVLRDIKMDRGPTQVSIGTLTTADRRIGFGLIEGAVAAPAESTPGAPAGEKAAPSLDAPAAAPPRPASTPTAVTGTAAAENVTIVNGTTTYRIKRIDLTGTPLTDADLANLLDTSGGAPVEDRLKKLTATSIVMPEIVAEDTTPGSERRATFQEVALSGVVAGRITAASVGGVTIAAKSGDDTLDGTTGAIQAYGVDLPQIAHVVAAKRTDDAEPVAPIYDSVTVNAIKLGNGNDGSFALATLKETNLKARPFKTDWRKAEADKGKLTNAEQAALLEDFERSFAFGTIEMVDLSAKGGDAKGPTSFDVADVTMRNLAEGNLGGIGVRQLRFAGPRLKIALGTLDIGPFALPAPKVGSASEVATNAMLPATLKIDLAKLDVDAGKDDSAPANHFVLNVAHAGLVSEGDPGDIPRSSKLAIDDVRFDPRSGNTIGQPLIDMGYGHLDLSAAMVTTYDPSTQALDLHDLTLKGVNMGSIGLGLQLVNVTKGIISPNQEIAKASMVAILVKGLSFDLVNEGFVDRLLAWKAQEDGMSVADEKAFFIDLFTSKLPASFDSANVKMIGDAVAKFIDKPKTLHIDIVSKNGLGIGSMSLLADPALLIDTLEVRAVADR